MIDSSKDAQTPIPPAELKNYIDGAGGKHLGFSFTRYWWDGKGERSGIKDWVKKKLVLGDDPVFGRAMKSEVLISDTAPTDYADLDFLLDRFDARLQPFEQHAFIQIKLTMNEGQSWVAGYELARAYARSYFVEQGLAVIIVAHVPGVAGSPNANHVHLIVLSRSLTINGFGEVHRKLCSDRGNVSTWDAWSAHIEPLEHHPFPPSNQTS